jgi:hypothetical protein
MGYQHSHEQLVAFFPVPISTQNPYTLEVLLIYHYITTYLSFTCATHTAA